MLRLHDVTVERAGLPAVRSVSMDIAPGQVTALLGAPGAGKTSLLEGICGTARVHSGSILLDGTRIERARAWRRKRLGIAHVEQNRRLFRSLTVTENLTLSCRERGGVDTAFDLFPELRRLGRFPAGLLSGGEQQMLALGRAVLARPTVLLIDEMPSGVAPVALDRLATAVRDTADSGVGVLLVERFAALTTSIADRVYVLAKGAIAFDGDSADLAGREHRLRALCLGEARCSR